MSESKKSGSAFKTILALIILLAVAGVLLVMYGNPQWHPKLYAYQARHAPDVPLEPKGNYSGAWNNWDQEGKLKSIYQYVNGRKDGPYSVYNSTGGVLSEGRYKAGELDGVQKVTMEDGVRSEIPYENGKRNGLEKTWYPSGALMVESPWVDGELEGIVTFYYDSGAVQSSVPYYKGKREGVMKTFHENGKVQGEESYRNDELNGKSEFWRIDETPELSFNYRDGRFDGLQTWYHPNGKPAREVAMSLGMPNGSWREWDEDGKLTVDDEYDMGELKKKPEKKEEGKSN